MSYKEKICFVLQRYGEGACGQEQELCRQFAQQLTPYYDIQLLATCAEDPDTWENIYPAGEMLVDGFSILRFPVTQSLNVEKLEELRKELSDNPYHDMIAASAWLREIGPYSVELSCYIRDNRDRYSAFIFIGSQNYTSACGIPLVPEKAIFIPMIREEETLRRCNYFRFLFSMPKAILYLSEEERKFTQQYFRNQRIANFIVSAEASCPWDQKILLNEEEFSFPYILAALNSDEKETYDDIVASFQRYKNFHQSELILVFLGKDQGACPADKDIVHIGCVGEVEKWRWITNAKTVVIHSHQEFFSLLMLEAMAVRIPVIVYGHSEIIKSQIRESNAGLYYTNEEEFVFVLDEILKNRQLACGMGMNGEKYVKKKHGKGNATVKLRFLIDGVVENQVLLAEKCREYEGIKK